ncbi:MAG TPA: hypothetical protein VE397_08950 [Stellaceae bacterium]|nr:hypothetical protein [Stellaceae bacterium]
MYTIECDQAGTSLTLPVSFPDKQLAVANACELVRAGFCVIRVVGPGFELRGDALRARRRASPSEAWGVTPAL